MIAPLPAGPHGGDGRALALRLGLDPDDVIDLSASLNPIAPDPAAIVSRHLGSLGRYPDPTAATEALAETLGVPIDRVVLTNGGAEAIVLLGRLIGGRVEEPDFSLYPRGGVSPAGTGANPSHAPLWRSNPHSPTGRLAAPTDRAEVWDEAFWPMATGTWSRGDDAGGSFIVGSLTKLLSCPGLRVGYAIFPDTDRGREVAAAFRASQPTWTIGGLVCEALPDLLGTVDLPAWARAIAGRRDSLATELAERGHPVDVDAAPWVLVHDATLRDRLAPHGIIVRDCGSFGMPGTVRIGLPRDHQLARLRRALDAIGPTPTDRSSP